MLYGITQHISGVAQYCSNSNKHYPKFSMDINDVAQFQSFENAEKAAIDLYKKEIPGATYSVFEIGLNVKSIKPVVYNKVSGYIIKIPREHATYYHSGPKSKKSLSYSDTNLTKIAGMATKFKTDIDAHACVAAVVGEQVDDRMKEINMFIKSRPELHHIIVDKNTTYADVQAEVDKHRSIKSDKMKQNLYYDTIITEYQSAIILKV